MIAPYRSKIVLRELPNHFMKILTTSPWILVFTLAVLLPITTACQVEQASPVIVLTNTPVVAATPIVTTSLPVPLTKQALENLAYHGIYDQAVTLTSGEYTGPPFVEGGASRPVVRLQTVANGDLDQDSIPDAVVVLAENSGGSGTFIYLAAVLNEYGEPVNTSTIRLGDRVQVQSLRVIDGQILVTALTHAPEDPLCCPSQQVEMKYLLTAGQLVPLENE